MTGREFNGGHGARGRMGIGYDRSSDRYTPEERQKDCVDCDTKKKPWKLCSYHLKYE